MTPSELKAARKSLGLTVEGFARAFGVSNPRTVRGWENGVRNGGPAPIPRPIEILVCLALELASVRKRLGIAPK